MSTLYWTGLAEKVSQVVTVTVGGTPAEDDIYSLVFVSEAGTATVVSVTADATPTVEEIVDALVSELQDAYYGLLCDAEKASATEITLSASTAGIPFCVGAKTDSVAGTIAVALTTENQGPSDWNCGNNWTSLATPKANDIVYLTSGDADICYGLRHDGGTYEDIIAADFVPSMATVALTLLNVQKSFAGTIGTATAYLQIHADTCIIGNGVEDNRADYGRINIDLLDSAALVNVYTTHRYSTDTLQPVRLLVNDTAVAINILGGTVGIASSAGESSELSLFNMSGEDTLVYLGNSDVSVSFTGSSPQLNKTGGTLHFWSTEDSILALVNLDGNAHIYGQGTMASLVNFGGTLLFAPEVGVLEMPIATVYGGTVYFSSPPTVLTVFANGIADLLSSEAGTITTLTVHTGGTIRLDPAVVTVTDPLTKAYELTF